MSTLWLSVGGGDPLADTFSEIVLIDYLTTMDISVDSDRLPRQRSLPVQWKRIYRLTVVLPRARYLSGLHATGLPR